MGNFLGALEPSEIVQSLLDAHSTEEEAKRWVGIAQAAEVARQAMRDEEEAIKEARRQQRRKKKASNGVVQCGVTCAWGKGEEDSGRGKQWPPASRCL